MLVEGWTTLQQRSGVSIRDRDQCDSDARLPKIKGQNLNSSVINFLKEINYLLITEEDQ